MGHVTDASVDFVNLSLSVRRLRSGMIRATSPRTNCSNSWLADLPLGGQARTRSPQPSSGAEEDPPPTYPAYPTCHAGRPDHGSDGAYPSWPAFSCEALCYIDGNCSSAFSIMATFAETTFEGPFGQCHQVPQKPTAPYTPFNDEKAFKPVEGVTRYLGVEGGSFFEAILRGFFGECAELHVLKHDALRRWVCGDRQAWSSAR
eukprot:m.840366 g.840366  ORF g.840366 m.840366 type:complete len:203 (-) comp23469_c0_seq38:592-1200(-)